MALIIRIISHPETEKVQQWQYYFPDNGGVIGRAKESTLVLADQTNTISNTHAIINKKSNGYQITDESSNGLFINNNKMAIGKGNISPLNDGDTLAIGEYRLLISCFEPDITQKKEFSTVNEITSPSLKIDQITNDYNNDLMSINSDNISFEQSKNIIFDDPFLTCDDEPIFIVKEAIKPAINSACLASPEIQNNVLVSPDLFDDSNSPALGIACDQKSANSLINSSSNALMIQDSAMALSIEFNELICQAANNSFNRILEELSPDFMEENYFSAIKKGFLGTKIDHWSIYKRHYKNLIENNILQSRFSAYLNSNLFSQLLKIKEIKNEKEK